MASFEEIAEAVAAARAGGCTELVVLHCVSAYPTPPEDSNLATIRDLQARLDVAIGLSDHTLDTTVATTSVAMGACVIEKHVTLSRADGGVDSAFSLEPDELARLVRDSRTAHAAIGKPNYGPTASEQTVLRNRRSLYVVKDMAAGEEFTTDTIRSIRPANGLAPKYLPHALGKRATRALKRGAPLSIDMIEGGVG